MLHLHPDLPSRFVPGSQHAVIYYYSEIAQRGHIPVREIPAGEDDKRGDMRTEAVRRDQVRKWGVVTLRQHIDAAHERRISTTAWNFFKKPYCREEHRARFVAFLASITASETLYLRDVASFFGELLDGSNAKQPERRYHSSSQQRAWLRAFLDDEPSWEMRLRAWIERARQERA
jgi:hypothetical protein